jgi:hypothetical protein
VSASGNEFVTGEAAKRRKQFADHGGGLAAGMRRQLGMEGVRKRINTSAGSLTGAHRAALNVAKGLLDQGEIGLDRYEGVASEIHRSARADRGQAPATAHVVAKSSDHDAGGGPADREWRDPLAEALVAYGDLLARGKADLAQVNAASARVRAAAA